MTDFIFKKHPFLSDKNFCRFLLAQTLSLTGGYIQNVALSSLITQEHNGKMSLGIFLCVCYLPVFLLSYPASKLVGRVAVKPIILVTEVLLFALSSLLVIFPRMPYFALLVFGGVWGTVRAFQTPAASSVPKLICKKEYLDSSVGAVNLALSVSRAAGPIISGLLYSLAGARAAFIANAVSYIPSVWFLYRTEILAKIPKNPKSRKANTGFYLMALVFVIALCGTSYNIIFTGLCKKLELTRLWFSVFMGCVGAGAVISALLYKKKKTLILAGAGMGLCALLLAFLKSGVYLCFAATLYGALDYLFFTSAQRVLNRQNSSGSIGAAMGIYTAVTTGALPLGYLVMSWLSGSFGVNAALYFSALLITASYLAFFGKIR